MKTLPAKPRRSRLTATEEQTEDRAPESAQYRFVSGQGMCEGRLFHLLDLRATIRPRGTQHRLLPQGFEAATEAKLLAVERGAFAISSRLKSRCVLLSTNENVAELSCFLRSMNG